MAQADKRQVRRRRVFYIPGYDPIHPRRYRELYRTEAAAQAAISGYDIAIAPLKGAQNYGWSVEGRMDGQITQSQIEVLVWSDIVRTSMASSIPATYLQMLRTSWTYIASGTLRRLMWLRKGPVIAALYPVGMLLLQLLLAVLLGWAVGAALGAGLRAGGGALAGLVLGDISDLDFRVFAVAQRLVSLGAGVFVAWRVLHWFKARDGKFFAYYLMHDYAYSAQTNGANAPELEARMAEFRATIAAAL